MDSSQARTTKKTAKEKWQLLFSKYFVWIALFVVMILCVIAWFAVFANEFHIIRISSAQEYETAQLELSRKEAQLAAVQQLEQQYEGVNEERLRQLESVLPIGLQETALISSVEELAQSVGLSVNSIDVSSDVQEQNTTPNPESTTPSDQVKLSHAFLRTATLSINVEAQQFDYTAMKKFVDALESFTPLVELEGLQYSDNTTGFSLQLRTYYREL